MTTKGLLKSSGYWNTVEAWHDWERLYTLAAENNLKEEADYYAPDPNWGWSRIDKRIGILKALLREHGVEVPEP